MSAEYDAHLQEGMSPEASPFWSKKSHSCEGELTPPGTRHAMPMMAMSLTEWSFSFSSTLVAADELSPSSEAAAGVGTRVDDSLLASVSMRPVSNTIHNIGDKVYKRLGEVESVVHTYLTTVH